MFSGEAGFTSEPALRERFPSEKIGLRAGEARTGSIQHNPIDGVSVWYVRHTDPATYARIRDSLTEEDFTEFADVRNADTRRRSLATRALLRNALSEAVEGRVLPHEWAFERNAYGKPHLVAPLINLHFSCSHTHSVSVVAVSSSRPIGIDIEAELPPGDDPSLIEEFFAAGERSALLRMPFEERAGARARLWSLKESVVKMLGTGLAIDVTELEFDIEADRLTSSRVPEVNVSGMRLATWSIPNKEQTLSVALAVKN